MWKKWTVLIGLIEFDKDAAELLKTNRLKWRVIHDDIANISCLDLEDYFGIKKENCRNFSQRCFYLKM